MISYQLESFAMLNAEAQGLFSLHAAEVASRSGPVALDIPSYQDLERRGALVVVTARKAGRIIGYLVLKIARDIHFEQRVAATDMFFVHQDERKHGIGGALIEKALGHLDWLGISKVFFGMKTKHPFRKLLRSKGFAPEEEVFVKEL
jgi:GNAT superfamily N-acetyltransferase